MRDGYTSPAELGDEWKCRKSMEGGVAEESSVCSHAQDESKRLSKKDHLQRRGFRCDERVCVHPRRPCLQSDAGCLQDQKGKKIE